MATSLLQRLARPARLPGPHAPFRSVRAVRARLAAGQLEPALFDRLARHVAAFHEGAAVAQPGDGFGDAAAVMAPVRQNFAQIRERVPMRRCCANSRGWRPGPRRSTPRWRRCSPRAWPRGGCASAMATCTWATWSCSTASRASSTRSSSAPSCAGPMSSPTSPSWSWTCRRAGAASWAWRFLNAWLERCGDYAGLRVLPWYLSYRAMVRAKIAAIRASQLEGAARDASVDECGRYLALAEAQMGPPAPALLVACGVSGAGKTSQSQAAGGGRRGDPGARRCRAQAPRRPGCGGDERLRPRRRAIFAGGDRADLCAPGRAGARGARGRVPGAGRRHLPRACPARRLRRACAANWACPSRSSPSMRPRTSCARGCAPAWPSRRRRLRGRRGRARGAAARARRLRSRGTRARSCRSILPRRPIGAACCRCCRACGRGRRERMDTQPARQALNAPRRREARTARDTRRPMCHSVPHGADSRIRWIP